MSQIIAIVISPYINHSSNTITAVSKVAVTYYLSPQLDLNRILGKTSFKYTYGGIPPFVVLLRFISVIAYLLHKSRILNDRYYLLTLGFLSTVLIESCNAKRPIIVTYQDYLTALLRHRFPEIIIINELIIDTVRDADNYASTIQAISDSSFVIYPNSSMSRLIPVGKPSTMAPYGGDNVNLYCRRLPIKSKLPRQNKDSILPPFTARIVVRANSLRKGGDIFFQALSILARSPQYKSCFQKIEFILAGQIVEPSLRLLAGQAIRAIRCNTHITLRYGQYTHNQFIGLLEEATLFIMPSRLESTSLAALEALYHSVPCILTPQCGVDQFQPNRHGLIFSSFEPQDLACLMSFCLSNYQALRAYRINLLSSRDTFSWSRYYAVYQDVIPRLALPKNL